MLSIPYFPQINMYACGPAVLQMILAYNNIYTDQIALAETLVPTNKGTDEAELVEALVKHGLYPVVKEPASLVDIENALKKENLVIVGFLELQRNEGHYVIVSGYDDIYLYIHDPWIGPNNPFEKEEFFTRWKSESGIHTRWMVEVKNPEKQTL